MGKRDRYQFQPVDVIGPDVLHDVSMHHQFCNGGKIGDVNILQNTEELQDIWMRQRIP